MRSGFRMALAVLVLQAVAMPAVGQTIEDTLVYIECKDDQNTVVSTGTGILVSRDGRVLTAGFVIPQEFEQRCRGSVGVADPSDTKRLIPQADTTQNAARILRFQTGTYPFAVHCALPTHAIRETVFAVGFPEGSRTGVPSFRRGILSTVVPDERGFVETDVLIGSGLAGGPVLSGNLAGIVGLAVAARFDSSTGAVLTYMIRSLDDLAPMLGLTSSPDTCFPRPDAGADTRMDELERRIQALEALIGGEEQ